MSKKPTKQSRKTAKRKARQAERRRVAALRRSATKFEGVTERNARRMSPERLEHITRNGKRRRDPVHVFGAGIAAAHEFLQAVNNSILTREIPLVVYDIRDIKK